MPKVLLLLLSLVFALSCKAQFYGLHSFFSDTSIIARLKDHKVKAVTEFINEKDTARFKGRYTFDTTGRTRELVTGRGPYYNRMTFEYDKKGRVTKQSHYHNLDTNKIEYWKQNSFDAKGRITKYEKGTVQDGKLLLQKEFEAIYENKKNGAGWMESRRYDGNKLESLSISRDSSRYLGTGKDTLMVTYKYRFEEQSGKKVATEKTISRSYKKGLCYFDDVIDYKVYGLTEVAIKIETRYQQLNAQGRWTEYGEINYDDAYEDFVQEHAEDFNLNYYSPLFIKALFDGEIQGVKIPEDQYTFDEKGLLKQTDSHGYRFIYNYNEKGLLIEHFTYKEEELVGTLLLWYNENGLVSKTINTYKNADAEDRAMAEGELEAGNKIIEEHTYTYTYY